MEEERIINPDLKNELEERLENSLRPASLDEYIGQDKVKENMKIYIEAAKKRVKKCIQMEGRKMIIPHNIIFLRVVR